MGKTGRGAFLPPSFPSLKMVNIKQVQEARDNQFLFQKFSIIRFLKSSKCSKTIVELTFVTQEAKLSV